MDIQLFCSAQIKEKMSRIFSKSGINLSDDAKIILVERGFEIPPEKLVIIFDPIDYMDAIALLNNESELKQGVPETVTGFSKNRYSLVPIQEIYHIDAHGSEIMCYSEKELYYLKNTLQYYEETLSFHGIIRINKSQLVNLINVKEIIPWFNGRLVLVLRNKQELEVSRFYAKALKKILNI